MSPGTPNNPINCGQGFTIHRRYEQTRRKEEVSDGEEAVETNVAAIARKSAGSRSRWLQTALLQAARGKLQAGAVYDVIVQDVFVAGVDDGVGGQMSALVHSNLHLFSPRQQRQLQSPDFLLGSFSRFAAKDGAGRRDILEKRASEEDSSRRDGQERRREEDEAAARPGKRRRGDEDASAKDEEVGSSRARPKTRATSAGRSQPSADAQARHEARNVAARTDADARQPRPNVEGTHRRLASDKAADSESGVFAGSGFGDLSARQHEVAEGREQSVEAATGAAFLSHVLEQIRSVGLHALQKADNGVVATCNGRAAGLRQRFFGEAQRTRFAAQLAAFRAKKVSGLSFLQQVLALLEQSNFQDSETEAALFLGLVIILLPDKSSRTALHERVLTLKKQLEEGIIDNWHHTQQ